MIKIQVSFLLFFLLSVVCHAQTIITVAGGGTSLGDGGPATSAIIIRPTSIACDHHGNYYVTDAIDHRVRKVSATGIISTIAGNGVGGFSGDGGPATDARLQNPSGIAIDTAGNIYVSDMWNSRVRKISSGIITTFAGNGSWSGPAGDGGPATDAVLLNPTGLAFDKAGNLYVCEGEGRVRKISTSGIITTAAGTGVYGCSGDGGPATSALLGYPWFVTLDRMGNLYISDDGCNRIRMVDTTGIIRTIAGSSLVGYTGDGGPASAATLSSPCGIVFDSVGNIFFADLDNHVVRKISTSDTITTIAGNGLLGYSGDCGPARSARMQPYAVGVDSANRLYICDIGSGRVRMLTDSACTSPPLFVTHTASTRVSMYPMVATGFVTINSPSAIGAVRIFTLTGQMLYSCNISTQKTDMDVSWLPPGIYLVRIGDTEIRKLVKE